MLSDYNNLPDLFIRLGLTPKESNAFFELVRLGACPVSRWAQHANIKRSSMYVLLNRFESQGLVTSFIHQSVLHVQAVPMTELPAILADKQALIEQTRELLIKNLPQLQKLEKNQGLTPKICFYEGRSRVETMYEKVIKEKSFKSFFHPGRIKAVMPEYFHKIPLAIRANGGSVQELLIDCKEAEEYRSLYKSSRHEIEILPATVNFSSDTIIADQKIFLVGYSTTGVVATEIWNEELAQTQSVIFDLIWSSRRYN